MRPGGDAPLGRGQAADGTPVNPRHRLDERIEVAILRARDEPQAAPLNFELEVEAIDDETRFAKTVIVALSVSPAKTGFNHLTSSTPFDPMPAVRLR